MNNWCWIVVAFFLALANGSLALAAEKSHGYTFKTSDGHEYQMVPSAGADICRIGNHNYYIEFVPKDGTFSVKATAEAKTKANLPGIVSFQKGEFDTSKTTPGKPSHVHPMTTCVSCSNGQQMCVTHCCGSDPAAGCPWTCDP